MRRVGDRLPQLPAPGAPVETLLQIVDVALFRSVLDKALEPSDRANGGRPPFRGLLKLEMLHLAAPHVFAQQKQRLKLVSRNIGPKRPAATIAMANIADNLGRWRWWQTPTVSA